MTTESQNTQEARSTLSSFVLGYFGVNTPNDLAITERSYPRRIRADLQRFIDRVVETEYEVSYFTAFRSQWDHREVTFSSLLAFGPDDERVYVIPPEYEEIDIGEDQPVRCLERGLWLLEHDGVSFGLLLLSKRDHQCGPVKFQLVAPNSEAGVRITREFFRRLGRAVARSDSYRGKVLSLEPRTPYGGTSTGVSVHRLPPVARDEVVFPRRTLELLERNVVRFAATRRQLAERRLSTKKGLLFYGPPGTGKTHTVRYLASVLEGYTTFLVAADEMGRLPEYMTLARLLRPSVVVIEDVDLVGEDRAWRRDRNSVSVLHQLLNEMDGLKPDSDVLFILTTNRPEVLERALASRPGRIDQAIEFPYPDEEGRARLIRMYASGLSVSDELVRHTATRVENVSGALIKELMRRAAQYQLERDAESTELIERDVELAIEELVVGGGALNRAILGASEAAQADRAPGRLG